MMKSFKQSSCGLGCRRDGRPTIGEIINESPHLTLQAPFLQHHIDAALEVWGTITEAHRDDSPNISAIGVAKAGTLLRLRVKRDLLEPGL